MAKAQTGLTVFFILTILGIVYFVGLAGAIGEMSAGYVLTNNISGLDGWFYTNVNFIITLGYVMALMAVGYYGMR